MSTGDLKHGEANFGTIAVVESASLAHEEPMKTLTRCAVFLLLATNFACSVGQAQSDVTEEIWIGTLDVKVAKLRLQLELTAGEDGNGSGKMISLDQNNAELPFSQFSRDEKSLSFEVKSLGIKFDGQFQADGKTLAGTFVQGPQKFQLEFEKGNKAGPQVHLQTWTGIMEAGGRKFDFQFRVFQDDEETLTAKLDSFSESIFGLHCDVTHGENGVIEIDVPAVAAKFTGTLSADGQMTTGKWNQAGNGYNLQLTKIPLDQTRAAKPQERPQTPKEPFPYRATDVEFENSGAKIRLAGTLTQPKSDSAAAVILINGSGPQDRDETIAGHKPFAVLADHLSRNGVAVLRYDERGVGKSTGNFSVATSADLATDVEAAIVFLKTRDDIDAKKIVLIGHSEGGLLAPMVAARRDDIAGIVLLAAPGVNGEKIVFDQSRKIAQASGLFDAEELDKQDQMLRIAFGLLKKSPAGADSFYEDFKVQAASVMGEEADGFELRPDLELAMRQLDTPWFRYFASYEPVPALQKITCPTLVLIGANDLQVNPVLNLPPIEAALKAANNEDVTIKTLPGLNHLFQTSETGLPGEYGSLTETFSPTALEAISQWMAKRF